MLKGIFGSKTTTASISARDKLLRVLHPVDVRILCGSWQSLLLPAAAAGSSNLASKYPAQNKMDIKYFEYTFC